MAASVRLTVDGQQPLRVVAKIKQAVAGLDAGYKKLQTSVNQAAGATKRFAVDLEKQTRTLREQTKGVQGLVAAYAGFRTLKGAITAGVELETAEKRAELLTQRFRQLAGIQQVAAQSANKFRIAQTDTLAALIDLGNRLGPQGASLAEIKDVYEGFNTILAINKVSTQEAAAAQLQLNQALGSGVLQGDEYRSINEATPQVIDAVAKILGVARGEVKKLASEGAVSAPVLIQALRNIKDQGADELEKSFESTSGRLREFQKAQTELAQAIGTQLLPAFTPLLTTVTSAIKEFAALPKPVKNFTAAVLGITAALVALGPILTTTIGLLKAVGVATLIAAGPWVALAAGITAATLALASYQSQAQKTAKAAATGDAQALHTARSRLHAVQQNLSLEKKALEEASQSQKRGISARIDRLRQEERILKEGIAAGARAEAGVTPAGGLATATVAGAGAGTKKKGSAFQLPGFSGEGMDPGLAAEQALGKEVELLSRANELLEARVEGTTREVENRQQIASIIERIGFTDPERIASAKTMLENIFNRKDALEDELDASQKLEDQQKKAAQQLDAIYKGVGQTLTSGVVDSITAAIDGTKSLGEVGMGILKDLANQMLSAGIQMLLSSISGPAGSIGGFLGKIFGGGKASGGTVKGGTSYLVGEKGPELFTPGRTGSIAPNGSMGGANVTVNVDASGTTAEGNEERSKQLGQALGAAVQAELIKQQRPGGLLAR